MPVFGPGLLLAVENRGIQDETVDSKISFIGGSALAIRGGLMLTGSSRTD